MRLVFVVRRVRTGGGGEYKDGSKILGTVHFFPELLGGPLGIPRRNRQLQIVLELGRVLVLWSCQNKSEKTGISYLLFLLFSWI